MYEVYGGEILAFGDLHFSDVYTGKHKDYLLNCCKVLKDIENIINEHNPKAVVFLGDLVGWRETNIKNRQVLSMFCSFWRRISTNRQVFAVRGNHDMRGYPDFNLLEDLGYIATPSYFDFYINVGDEEPQVRFHLVPYGNESKPLELLGGNVTNVVLGHNNYTISGYTTWYAEHDGIEVSSLQNYVGVSLIVSGHIHAPSPELYGTAMQDGSNCNLYYLGCPTRPAREYYDSARIASFKVVENMGNEEVEFDIIDFPLVPSSELYHEDDSFIEEKNEQEIEEAIRKEKLAEVLSEITKFRLLGGDPMQQVDLIPNATDEAKSMCKKYIELAMR